MLAASRLRGPASKDKASGSGAGTCLSPLGAEVRAGSRAAGNAGRLQLGLAAAAGSVLPALLGFCASSAGEPCYLNASLSRREINVKLGVVLNLASLGIGL